jgi:toxin-antitoxin system PIN domain toxin
MQKSKLYLPDVNVWLAIAADGHIHHESATTWFDTLGAGEATLCRITQMGFLRLLTNPHAMRTDVLTQKDAWRVLDRLREDERVAYSTEPENIEPPWRTITQRLSPSHNLWTDCYLHAFATALPAVVVTFDKTFATHASGRPFILR